MSGRAMKVAVEIRFSAQVSCPGVHLPGRDDLYLSVFFLDRYRHSESRPAVFPLLLKEKMSFEKIFSGAVDPGDLAAMLEYETVRIKLVQLTPPVGETLAHFEEDTLRFLFPEPKLVPSFSGKDREVLMRRTPDFPGIAPRLEFSTRTTISQIHIHPNRLLAGWRSSSSPRIPSAQWQSVSSSSHTQDAESSEEDSSSSWTPSDSSEALEPVGVSRSEWEEVHRRVRGLLTTPGALRRLLHGATHAEVDELWG